MSYSRIPCAMPNSFTPLSSPAFPDRNGVDRTMARGVAVLQDLVESLGGVWPGSSGSGSYGSDGSTDQSGLADRDGGGRLGGRLRLPGFGGRLRGASKALPEACGPVVLSDAPGSWRPVSPVLTQSKAPVISPRVARRIQNQPKTPVVVVPSVVVQQTAPPPVVLPVAPPVPVRTVCDDVTPQNVCSLIQRGCFRVGQVDILQLAACAASGWAGNRNEFPAVVLAGGGNGGHQIGLMNPYPLTPSGQPGAGIVAVNDSSYAEMQRTAAGLGAVRPFETSGHGAMALGLILIAGVVVLARKGSK